MPDNKKKSNNSNSESSQKAVSLITKGLLDYATEGEGALRKQLQIHRPAN